MTIGTSGRTQIPRLLVLLCGTLLLVAVASGAWKTAAAQQRQAAWPALEGYEAMKIPPDNPMTAEKVELGKQLFYDTRLSADGTRSCYACHLKEKGLTDGRATAVGAFNTNLPRSSPTLWNIGYHSQYYWDGRSNSLEAQALAAWRGGNMGASGQQGRPSADDLAGKLNQIAGYQQQFQKVFGGPATADTVAKAIAAFERTLVSVDSAWVRFRSGRTNALSAAARRGWEIFDKKAKCSNCHSGLLLTDQQYHNVGIGMDAEKPDVGRFTVSKVETETGAFKTPTLLDISKSAPYFHNGSVATLEEAVDMVLGGGKQNKFLDTVNLEPVQLTAAEKADLLAFLRALDVNYTVKEPRLPK